ncbi:hypothetical protein [Streptomyces sp. MA5143a]|uniref:hypothetical protein n=1 Tax=Streptomyces sp. MA5143a TaxID=2083010 RepID=UPI0011B27A5B|nr:hypothetical protein [Streptomyces sp. MA5143a]
MVRHLRSRRYRAAAVGAVLLGTLAACAGDSTARTPPSRAAARPTASAVVYTSKAFGVPLTVTVPTSLGVRPLKDTRTFLTWMKDESDRVRFLLPVVVYPPGRNDPVKPARDYDAYLAFLRGQSDYHAKWRDTDETTVDGHPATLMTGTTDWSLNGSIGCPTADGNAEHDCYGLQPEFALRLAVIDIGDRTPLVAWTTVNTDQQPDTAAAFTRFETMLRGLRFTSRR